MSTGGDDLRVLSGDGEEEHTYVLYNDDVASIVHSTSPPNVPMNTGYSTPTQAGGVYDVRDSDGDKAITHLDWSNGAGQPSLDTPDALYSKFWDSQYIDNSVPGQISLYHKFNPHKMQNASGPIFSALGKVWLGFADGTLQYNDGTGWLDATITSGPDAAITGWETDGDEVYVCASGGTTTGVWKGSGSTLANVSSSAITALAYSNGIMFAASTDGAGTIDTSTGTYTGETPTFLSNCDTVSLVAGDNEVYWVAKTGDRSFVYKLWWDTDTSAVMTAQYAQFVNSFVATCAIHYLGGLYVGGYYKSIQNDVGQGAVYLVTDNVASLLFTIGSRPEDTALPSDYENNNRIRACVPVGKDIYWLTERDLYRWDLDIGGYNQVAEFPGCGFQSRVVDTFSENVLPTGGTISTNGEYTVHLFTSSDTFSVPTRRDKYGNLVSTLDVEYLVCAGGGGGGSNGGGGGGGGGVAEDTATLTGDVTVTIGAGGAAGLVGSDTILGSTKTVSGGGAGGDGGEVGGAGGSGGGAGADTVSRVGGAGTAGEGYSGGDNAYITGGHRPSGGGGGAGAPGGDATEVTE